MGKQGKFAIAIDGPAGAGKSTIAKMVAKKLGYRYIDTGAMYRALTLKALRDGVNCNEVASLLKLLKKIRIEFKAEAIETSPVVLLDGEDVSCEIRSPEVGRAVSIVAQFPEVRKEFIRIQRELAAGGGIVMDGRDIGTVVLPLAEVKIFLSASLAERAKRRHIQLLEYGLQTSIQEVTEEVTRRDQLDQERELAPLVQAPDAYYIDTTAQTPEQVVARVIELCKNAGAI